MKNISLKGVNGTVIVHDDKVVIKREGMLAKMTQGMFAGDKEIAIKTISAIQFREGTSFANGYIQFSLPGEGAKSKSLSDKTQDENTVMFRKGMFDNKVNEEWKKLKEHVQSLMDSSNQQGVQTSSTSSADELEKFSALKDQGIITQEEFDAKKKELLNL